MSQPQLNLQLSKTPPKPKKAQQLFFEEQLPRAEERGLSYTEFTGVYLQIWQSMNYQEQEKYYKKEQESKRTYERQLMDYRDKGKYQEDDKVYKIESYSCYRDTWKRVNGKLTLSRAPGIVQMQNYNKCCVPSQNGIRNFRQNKQIYKVEPPQRQIWKIQRISHSQEHKSHNIKVKDQIDDRLYQSQAGSIRRQQQKPQKKQPEPVKNNFV